MEEEEKSDIIILLHNQNTKYNPPTHFASPTTTINLQQITQHALRSQSI